MFAVYSVANVSGFRRVFTLIEMMVVIAVIGVLAALLMPTLRKAIDASQRTSCANNFRQIGIGFVQYSEEYNGYMPPAYAYPSVACNSWNYILKPFLGYSQASTWSGGWPEYGERAYIYECPVDDFARVDGRWPRSYAVNPSLCAVSWNTRRLSGITTKAMLAKDYFGEWNRQHISDQAWLDSWQLGGNDDLDRGYRHSGGCNILRIDSSVNYQYALVTQDEWNVQ